jgi:hypothetical protein
MRPVRFAPSGAPRVLTVRQVPRPSAGPAEVLLGVRALGGAAATDFREQTPAAHAAAAARHGVGKRVIVVAPT